VTPAWDARLISRDRALELAGAHPVYLEDPGTGDEYLRCGKCQGNITRIGPGGALVTCDHLLAAVLRHLVTAHGQELSRRKENNGR
jgi:hypothetical protein